MQDYDDDEIFARDLDDDDFPYGCTADGCPLNEVGMELGFEGLALTDEEKECFCRW